MSDENTTSDATPSSPDIDADAAPDRANTYRSIWRSLKEVEFRQGYVDAGGVRTRYVTAGPEANDTVLLLHGTGGHWEAFSRNIAELAQHLHVVALDLLGCGFTDKPDRPYEIADYVQHVRDFMDAVDIPRAAVIGVSLGSWVACRLAHDNPERVTKMILNSPAGLLPLSAAAQQRSTIRRGATATPNWDNVAATLEQLFYEPTTLIDDLVAIRYDVYSSPSFQAAGSRVLTLFDPEIRQRNLLPPEQWAEIHTPTLIIAHVDSPDDYLDTAQALPRLMPAAQMVTVHRVSHWPQFERPDEFNRLAIDYLTGDGSENIGDR